MKNQWLKSLLVTVLFVLMAGLPIFAQEQNTPPPSESLSIIQKVEQWYKVHTNYATITVLMAVESSFIPFPSEVVIPPAAYTACEEGSDLNIFLVVLFGTLGAVIGALINYFLAMYLGRTLIYKFADSKLGRLCLLNSEKVDKAEQYFNDHGNISTFIGRLIPGIRQLISIPAGLSKMNLFNFILYTSLGAAIWNIVLATIGYLAHGQQEQIHEKSHELSLILAGLAGLFFLYLLIKFLMKSKNKSKQKSEPMNEQNSNN